MLLPLPPDAVRLKLRCDATVLRDKLLPSGPKEPLSPRLGPRAGDDVTEEARLTGAEVVYPDEAT